MIQPFFNGGGENVFQAFTRRRRRDPAFSLYCRDGPDIRPDTESNTQKTTGYLMVKLYSI